jgi:hypothetical protein
MPDGIAQHAISYIGSKRIILQILLPQRKSIRQLPGAAAINNKLLPLSDWVLRVEPNAEQMVDERFLIAGMILFHEYDIAAANTWLR